MGEDKGFGYIIDQIPELAIAVLPEYGGQGIGSQLLMQLLEAAKGHFPSVSLNVRDDHFVFRRFSTIDLGHGEHRLSKIQKSVEKLKYRA